MTMDFSEEITKAKYCASKPFNAEITVKFRILYPAETNEGKQSPNEDRIHCLQTCYKRNAKGSSLERNGTKMNLLIS